MHHACLAVDTCHNAHMLHTGYRWTQIVQRKHRDTQEVADISKELQRIQGVESHLVKEDQTAGNENH